MSQVHRHAVRMPRGRMGDGLVLLGGALLPLAFAPYSIWPLAVLSPALLFCAWLDLSPRQAAWRGWLFGLGLFGVGVWWVSESFQFNHVAWPLAVVLTVLFIAFLAGYPALLGYLVARCTGLRRRTLLLLVYPSTWVLAEWLRGWLFTGFPWLQLGYSQLETPLAGLVPVIGVLGVGWVVAVSAGLVVFVIGTRGGARVLAVVGLVAPWILGHALQGVQWTSAGEARRVALVQGNVPQDQKWLPSQRDPTLRRYVALTRAHWGVDLVVWPETAVPAFYRNARGFLDALAQEARGHGTDMLIGIPVRSEDDERYFNGVVALSDSGGMYRKRHLVPFGEYLPLRPLLGPVVSWLGIPLSDFSPGPAEQPLPRVAGEAVGVSICYEGVFGAELIGDLPRATLLVNVSNDAWFGRTNAAEQHLQMARMRALETGRYLLRATNTGVTALIDPRGREVERLPRFQSAVLVGEARGMHGTTPYARTGDLPVVLLQIGLVTWLGWRSFQIARRGRLPATV